MQTVNGIGGVFFRAENPEALSAWYEKHLGVSHYNPVPWKQREGYTVFAPFAKDTDYFGSSDQQWMINFRVDDLAAMIAQLEAAGITVETHPDWDSEVGKFARIHDPEGNPVELWEPNQ
ncbi:hypothetical protein SAMN05444358_101157 [Ruegeria halocynthiae]|uniref:VOC domain-containing protein n=1 Tax=Ruegeria halocynthiae TaxID=985054 RepID=A0A1H2RGG5_9RHOB|nr:VOC family protein [Ruegeria halocynthiae]SDW18542.1 hypothetical protein SAMN05444358_101157 [Ruegeria halocynthiae]